MSTAANTATTGTPFLETDYRGLSMPVGARGIDSLIYAKRRGAVAPRRVWSAVGDFCHGEPDQHGTSGSPWRLAIASLSDGQGGHRCQKMVSEGTPPILSHSSEDK
jgi:hypothetical protein